LSDKDFKVKNKLTIAGLTNSSGVLIVEGHTVDSHTNLATQYGGTGTTTSPSSAEFLYSSAGTTYAPTSLGSVVPLWTAVAVSSNIALSKNTNYFVDTSAARTLTLPASPATGDEIHIFDASSTAATNKITVSSNSNKINGSVQDLDIDANNAAVVLIYTGSTYGWRVG
jgi:hypothetical protein